MNIFLFVSLHVFLLLAGVFFYYLALFNFLSRDTVSKKALIWRVSIGFLAVLSAWVIEPVFLRGYFIGILGFVTDSNVVSFVPTLVFVRELLFLSVIVIGFTVSLTVLFKLDYINEREHLKTLLLVTVSILFASTLALAVLGVLIP